MNSTYYIYDLFIDRDMDIQFLSVFAFICWWLKSQKISLVIDFMFHINNTHCKNSSMVPHIVSVHAKIFSEYFIKHKNV